ncbi:MAG TPA: tripartite tricarboxylate transporter substrate binding protein [Burkholderiales bacterium]|jgi:tripartite-type tricarboxylate transporter receptor subunit TctC|nr:tripartite tricarboxylate transporter substrate binding protein [Burkholderiales bacterium]
MKRWFLFAVAALFAGTALAQYPGKPIRIVVPFPAGSATDTITRILGASVSGAIGQAILVDNKAGADGAIAAAEVARSSPDGYTLLMATNSPMSVVPAMKKSPPYDPIADFTPITDIGRYTFFLYANAATPFRSFQELIAYAKANPGKLNYATGNTTGIVSFIQMNSLAGIEMTHVPYKGEPQGISDLVAGRVQLMWATPTTGLSHVKDGKLRAIVTSLKARSELLPDVPTIYEAGMPQFTIVSWAGLYGPAKLPKEAVQRLNKEFLDAMKRPDVQAQMQKQAFAMNPSTPEQLATHTREQLESYRRILRAAGVQPE